MKKIIAPFFIFLFTLQLKAQNVGIGTNAPAASLHVKRNGGIDAIPIVAQFQGTANSSYFHYGTDETTIINGGKVTSSVFINPLSNGGVYLSQNGGGVIIGGGSLVPSGALEVIRSGSFTARFNGANNYSSFNEGTTENTLINGGKPTSIVYINSNSSGNVFIGTGGGNVAIGNINPLATLTVARGTGANGSAQFAGTTYSSHFNYSTEETTFIRGGKATSQVLINDVNTGNVRLVEGGGNVGIGVTIPTAKLEVAGQIKINGGSPGAGKVLTSDANGLATWENKSAGDGFRVFASGSTAITNGNTGTLLFNSTAFGNGSFDDGGNFNNATNSYVAPKDGVYQFNATIRISNGTATSLGVISLQASGNTFFVSNLPVNTIRLNIGDQYPESMSISFITKMQAGDSINLKGYQTVGGTVTFAASGISQFTGVRLY